MIWNEHSNLKNKHAILSPSGFSWINYTDENNYESLIKRCKTEYATTIGTIIHNYAQLRINTKKYMNEYEISDVELELLRNGIPEYAIDIAKFYETLKEYVNDAIEYRMDTEQVLYYSDNSFGTADAISYSKKILRIHDLKTGNTPAHFEQLEIYAALFFLEYGKKLKLKPETTSIEFRIYQFGEISVCNPEPNCIYDRIDKIIELDNAIDAYKTGRISR